MPQRKKDSSVRARTNKASTRATLRRVEADESPAAALEEMTVAQLRDAVDAANASRPADQQIPRRGRKAELIAALTAHQSPVPSLPEHPGRYDETTGTVRPSDWHDQTVSWWNDVWRSPMAMEWDDSDVHNLHVLALLYDDIWTARGSKARREALTEYRQQRADLGLSPYARRRLEWTIETAEDAKARGEKRRTSGRVPVEQPKKGDQADPRAHLVAVQ
ncbi:MAG: hypothetical protein HOV78_11710 [Hamadaea sp.]|nr:hypothetical protein [Hamadaea sp.]